MQTNGRRAHGNRISATLLFATVALAPLPFGSTGPAFLAVWCFVLGIAAIAARPDGLRRPHRLLLGLAGVFVALYALVIAQQLSGRAWLPGAAPNPLWRSAADALGTPLAPTVSIVRSEPLLALGAPLSLMLALVCGLIVCADRDRARQLLKVIAWSGAAYAAFGILSFLIDPTKIFWFDKRAYFHSLTGTFTNRNTAAVFFGACSVVWLMILFDRARRYLAKSADSGGWRQAVHLLAFRAPRDVVVAFCMLLLCVVAALMTGSRAGVVLSLATLVLAAAVYLQRVVGGQIGLPATIGIGVGVALALVQFVAAGVSGRFDAQGFADEGRLDTYRATWRMVLDHPWFGTGLGTFAWSYPAYRADSVSLWGVWDRAHNTLLEIAAELGLPLAAAVVLAWCVMISVLVHGVRKRRRDLIVPVAALGVATLALLHSLIDFSLQIPGFALLVFALVGAGLAQSFRTSEPS